MIEGFFEKGLILLIILGQKLNYCTILTPFKFWNPWSDASTCGDLARETEDKDYVSEIIVNSWKGALVIFNI
jgi:hypothetical protein